MGKNLMDGYIFSGDINVDFDTLVFYNNSEDVCKDLKIKNLRVNKEFYIKKYDNHIYLFIPISCTYSSSFTIIQLALKYLIGRKLILIYAKDASLLHELKYCLKYCLKHIPNPNDFTSIGGWTGNGNLLNIMDQIEIQNFFDL